MDQARRQAILEVIRAQLVDARADRALKACVVTVSVPTAGRVFKGADYKLSTLLDIADAMDCDVLITIQKRPAA